ncbi:U3 snoRNA associated-domain-containing protein [Aspergillus pseudoustus]|uniref:U3 snoRNA associated-domain-containing protein n=1 Tax=Aspergillus pseudoustus TaxID=1810923 RepID=A0ABR4KE88_9EURO
MLSQIVTAAKGLIFLGNYTKIDSDPSVTVPENPVVANQKMVTTRRQSAIQVVIPAQEAEVNGSPGVNGKRKSKTTASTTNDETQRNKRRKKAPIQSVEEEVKQDATELSAPKKHFRFDSEEPEPVLAESTEQELPEDVPVENQDGEDTSDDEAPETVDNSAQLAKIKSEAKKREQAKQLEEQLKKEKRRQFDEARKAQAKASGKRKEAPGAGTPGEDMLSESSATLQGSYTQDARHPTSLPALLPDDVLNAVPDVRPPTPPPETQAIEQKKPTKLRFLDKQEKGPKDVRMGDVAIHVLGGDSSKKTGTALPPKASKTGRSARETWLKQARSTGHINGMRMVSSGSKGFVRK